MAKDDYDAGLRGETAGHDVFSPDYQDGTRIRQRGGRGGGVGDGGVLGGMAGGGIVFVAVMVIAAFFAFIFVAATYPVAAAITGTAFGIGAWYTNADGHNTMNGVGLIFAWMIPCFIVYFFAMKVEHFVAGSWLYRAFRTIWRILAATLLGFVIGSATHTQGGSLTGVHLFDMILNYMAAGVGFLIGYMNSIRLDDKHDFTPVHIKPLDRIVKILIGWAPGYQDSAFAPFRKSRTRAEVLKTRPYEPAEAPKAD